MRPTTNIPKIIFEDQDLIVLDKPAGLLVHAAESTHKQATLVDFLLNNYPELKGVGEDSARPAIVHRLDKDTSGVMVIAHNQDSYKFLKKAFQDRTIVKKYQALVFGSPKEDSFMIDMPLRRTAKGIYGARHAEDVKKLNAKMRDQYRPAQTQVKVLKRFGDLTLLELQPKTGRTHQLRVHLKAVGLPIVGDQLYSNLKQRKLAEKKWNLKRQFLHAVTLSFKHPHSHQEVTFEAALPEDLQRVIKSLEKKDKNA